MADRQVSFRIDKSFEEALLARAKKLKIKHTTLARVIVAQALTNGFVPEQIEELREELVLLREEIRTLREEFDLVASEEKE